MFESKNPLENNKLLVARQSLERKADRIFPNGGIFWRKIAGIRVSLERSPCENGDRGAESAAVNRSQRGKQKESGANRFEAIALLLVVLLTETNENGFAA